MKVKQVEKNPNEWEKQQLKTDHMSRASTLLQELYVFLALRLAFPEFFPEEPVIIHVPL